MSSAFNHIDACVLKHLLESSKITDLHPWQKDCLSQLSAKFSNLLICACTGSGKTLIADLLCLTRLLQARKSKKHISLIILPYIALVKQRAQLLQAVCDSLGVRMAAYHTEKGSTFIEGEEQPELVVCTLEKANMVLNKVI
jgi:replicative superfamily II helicase